MLTYATTDATSGCSRATRRSSESTPGRCSGASSVVLSHELARRPEVPLAPERALRQRRAEVLAALVGEPRRGAGLIPNKALVGARLEQVREAPPGDDQRGRGAPHAIDRRLVVFQVDAGLVAEDTTLRAAVVVRPLQAAQVQHLAVDEGGGA